MSSRDRPPRNGSWSPTAAYSGLVRAFSEAAVEMAVHDDQAATGPEHPDPLVDRRLRVWERPEQMPADDEVEAAGRERKLLGVGLLEPDRDRARCGLAARFRDHGRREVDTGDMMTPGRELEGEKPCAAPDVERVEGAAAGEHEIEDAIPRSALGGRADAVAEVLVEARGPPIPVGGHLSLDDVSQAGLTAAAHGLHLLDDFDLNSVGGLEEADPPAVVVGWQLLENPDAIGSEPGQRCRVVVGVHGDVLEAVVLLALLRVDQGRDVELQPMKAHAVAATRLADQRRAEVVDVELHRRLGIPGLHMNVVRAEGHVSS